MATSPAGVIKLMASYVKLCRFSGQARDRQNPVDLEKLAADISVPLVPQDEPS